MLQGVATPPSRLFPSSVSQGCRSYTGSLDLRNPVALQGVEQLHVRVSRYTLTLSLELITSKLSGTESRIARFPESRACNRQKFRSEKQTHDSNRKNKSIQNRHPNRILSMFKATLESRDSNRTIQNRPILDSESPIQCH